MLVLTRKPGESLILFSDNHEIKVKISRVEGKSVSVAIDAPKEVKVLRSEVHDRNQGELKDE